MRVSRRWSRTPRAAAVVTMVAAGWLAAAALPAHAAGDAYAVTVLVVSEDPGGVDPGAARFDRILRKRLRYESLRLVSRQHRSVARDEIGTVPVPGAPTFRFRPIDSSDKGTLVSVEWGATRGDFRLRRGKPLILGGPATAGGELVVVLESR